MARFFESTTLLVVVFVLGQCGGNLFVNTNYNKYGTNPYLGPVFNGSSPAAENAPAIPGEQPAIQESTLPNVEQGVVENESNNNVAVPLEPVAPQQTQSPSEGDLPKNQAEATEQPLLTNDVVPSSNPPNQVHSVQADPAVTFQNPQNLYYPAVPVYVPPPQNNFGSSQASFPAPNYSGNPYLQGFFPGSPNQPQNPPPQNSAPFPSVPVPPPQVALPLPPISVAPAPPQGLAPQNPNNPFVPNQTPSVPQLPPYPPQQPPAQAGPTFPPPAAPAGFANNNNPYLQNLNPPPAQNPQGNAPSNSFFPSVPLPSVPQQQQPTQSYPTPCTYIPSGVPAPAQGVTYQPVPALAGKNLRSRCLKPRGQFPSDKCNYFINCWDHDVREQPCPPGLAFSSKGYCDFEGNVDCNGLPLAAIPAAGQSNGGVTNSNQIGGSFVNQGSFVPVQVPSGQPVLPAVAPTVPVPQELQPAVQPIQPSNDQSSQSTIAQSSPSSIAASVPIVPNDVAVETFSNQQPPQANPAVTIPAAFPEQSGSTFAPTAAPIPSTTVDPALKAKCLQPRGQFATEICNRYINCWDHVVRIEECPKGMSFSEKGYCDFDFSVNCGNRTYDSKGSIEGNADCPTPHGTFRDKRDCSQYYTCMFGQIVAKYGCAQGLSYNDMLGVCDYSQNVDCTHAPLVYPPTENHVVMQQIKEVEGAPNTSKCTPGSIYRLNPQCTSAVLCRYGFTEIVECPAGLAYDSVTDKCLLPHLAKC